MTLRLAGEVCGSLEVASEREWLETNGLGGYASATVVGLNTRRYHGLLVAALEPPVRRMVLLSCLDETLVIGGARYELATHRYPGTVHPNGYRYLLEFHLDPWPRFVYEVDGWRLEKSLFLRHGESTTVVRFSLTAPAGAASASDRALLELRPLVAFRDYHCLTHRNDQLDPRVTLEPGRMQLRPYAGLPGLYMAHNAREVSDEGCWYYRFQYDRERERGLDYEEDLFNPCTLTYEMSGADAIFIASLEPRSHEDAPPLEELERRRRQALREASPSSHPWVSDMAAASDALIVRREDHHSVIAGYHWFSDWGRDALIALPGLTLVTGRPDAAKSILLAFARWGDQGMIPNRFPDSGESPEYNTVDATLWFFEAVRSLVEHTGDPELVRTGLYEFLIGSIDWHVRGTRFGIRMDGDGLLQCGAPGQQLTWMDARVGDWVVTPRQGKPVEIQALWHNALLVTAGLAKAFGDRSRERACREMAAAAHESFNKRFWNADLKCLYDVVDGEGADASIRPNQLFALSLRHTMLDRTRARAVLGVVRRELLTPVGLRTLSPRDPSYRGRYEGDVLQRDGSYHQGTVWPWLMGPFVTAWLRFHGRSETERRRAAGWLEPLRAHMAGAGLGHLPELFDGDPPHRPGGCIAQAWSLAELLRAAVDELQL